MELTKEKLLEVKIKAQAVHEEAWDYFLEDLEDDDLHDQLFWFFYDNNPRYKDSRTMTDNEILKIFNDQPELWEDILSYVEELAD